jgi:outer membrane protein assembly factor BamB
VQGRQVWLTTALEAEGSLRAVCLDFDTGRIVHDVEVFRRADLGRINAHNSHASPTPVLDGQRVFVHFGSHGTACLGADGQVLWRNQSLAYDHGHGPAGSPLVWNDLVIVACDGVDRQFVAALDKRTGDLRWRRERSGPPAYSTPLVVRGPGGEQIVSVGGGLAAAYAPRTGAEIWRFRFEGYSVVPRPVTARGRVFFCSGYETPTLYAVDLDGQGDVTETHLAWAARRGVPHTPSPLVMGRELYMLGDKGVLVCLNLDDGRELWRKRLRGTFYASPVYAAGRIYLVNDEATTYVLDASRRGEVLAENRLTGRVAASPAIVDGSLLLRTDRALYRLDPEDARVITASAEEPAPAPFRSRREPR